MIIALSIDGVSYVHLNKLITFNQIKKDKITRLVVLPLYPQYSISTTGSSIRVLQDLFRFVQAAEHIHSLLVI